MVRKGSTGEGNRTRQWALNDPRRELSKQFRRLQDGRPSLLSKQPEKRTIYFPSPLPTIHKKNRRSMSTADPFLRAPPTHDPTPRRGAKPHPEGSSLTSTLSPGHPVTVTPRHTPLTPRPKQTTSLAARHLIPQVLTFPCPYGLFPHSLHSPPHPPRYSPSRPRDTLPIQFTHQQIAPVRLGSASAHPSPIV